MEQIYKLLKYLQSYTAMWGIKNIILEAFGLDNTAQWEKGGWLKNTAI